MIDPRVQALCDEFSITIVPSNHYPEPGQTRAPETIRLILDRWGMDHARLVMNTLAETANNRACLNEVGFWMTSDMVRFGRRIIAERAGDWLETWDAIPAESCSSSPKTFAAS